MIPYAPPGPPISTRLHAFSLAEVDHQWRIVATSLRTAIPRKWLFCGGQWPEGEASRLLAGGYSVCTAADETRFVLYARIPPGEQTQRRRRG